MQTGAFSNVGDLVSVFLFLFVSVDRRTEHATKSGRFTSGHDHASEHLISKVVILLEEAPI